MQTKDDDWIEHLFTASTHDYVLFFTSFGKVYRAKAYEVSEAGRDSKGQHVANLLALQGDETITQVLDLRDHHPAGMLP